MTRRPSTPTLLLIAAALALSACGEDRQVLAQDPVESSTKDDSTELLRFAVAGHATDGSGGDANGDTDSAARRAAIDVLERRLAALGVEDAEVAEVEGFIEVVVPREHAAVVAATVPGAGQVEFRPVLAFAPPGAEPPTPAPGADVVQSEDGTSYVVGRHTLDGAAIESATAALDPAGMWTVSLVMREGADGVDAFNELATYCFRSAPDCPDLGTGVGQLAIVFDGVVLTAPGIHTERFERDQIAISGHYDETSASALAAMLSAGASPLTFVPAD